MIRLKQKPIGSKRRSKRRAKIDKTKKQSTENIRLQCMYTKGKVDGKQSFTIWKCGDGSWAYVNLLLTQ